METLDLRGLLEVMQAQRLGKTAFEAIEPEFRAEKAAEGLQTDTADVMRESVVAKSATATAYAAPRTETHTLSLFLPPFLPLSLSLSLSLSLLHQSGETCSVLTSRGDYSIYSTHCFVGHRCRCEGGRLL